MVSSVENASGHGCVSEIGCGYRNHCRILWLPLALLFVLFVLWGFGAGPWAESQSSTTWAAEPHTLCTGVQCPDRVHVLRILLPPGTAAPWLLLGCSDSSGAAAASASPWWLILNIQTSSARACPSPGYLAVLILCTLCSAHLKLTRLRSFAQGHERSSSAPTWPRLPCGLSSMCFPPWRKQLLCRLRACPDPGWGGSWEHNWELSNASGSPVQTQSTQQENICPQGVLCRACNAWIIFVCSCGEKWMDPNPAQSRVSAASSSGWVHSPCLQLLPILCSRGGRGAAAQSSGTCWGCVRWQCLYLEAWPWRVCLSLVSWEGQEGSSDICLLFRKNNWCLGKFLLLHI